MARQISHARHIWSGLTVGVGIGTSSFDYDLEMNADRTIPDHPSFGDLSILGSGAASGSDDWDGFGTVQLGYDQLIGSRLLIGAFADFDFGGGTETSVSASDTAPLLVYDKGNPNFAPGNSFIGSVETDNIWTVGGRIGVLVAPGTLLYGLAGYSELEVNGNFNVGYQDKYHAIPMPSVAFNERLEGFVVGAGGEVALDERLSLKLEYRYSQYGGETFEQAAQFYVPEFKVDFEDQSKVTMSDLHQHSIRGALVFKLGELD